MRQGSKSIPIKEYWAIHSWVRKNFGKATFCENHCGTDAKVFDYALIHGKKYGKDRANFKMLCKKCHYVYDDLKTVGPKHPMWGRKHTEETREKMKLSSRHLKPNLGKKASPETKLKMSLVRKGRPHSKEHCMAISKSLKNKPKSAKHRKALSEARKRGSAKQ